MFNLPFQPPASSRGAIPAAQQFHIDRRPAGRARFQRHGRSADNRPARPRRAGPRLRIETQDHHTPPRPFHGQGKTATGRQVITGEPAPRFEQDRADPRATRRFQPGSQQFEFIPGFDKDQLRGREAKHGQPFSTKDSRQGPGRSAHKENGPRPIPADRSKRKGHGRRPVNFAGMHFMQATPLQTGDAPVG